MLKDRWEEWRNMDGQAQKKEKKLTYRLFCQVLQGRKTLYFQIVKILLA